MKGAGRMIVAEVYNANREYPGGSMWRTPSRIVVSSEDIERGVHFRQCLDCLGTGVFDLPDTLTEGVPPLRCNACKGTGLSPVMV